METTPFVLAVVVALFVTAELIWSRRSGLNVYDAKESLANVGIAIVNGALKPLTVVWTYVVMSLIEPLQFARLPETAWAFAMTFVITDLAYYWYHRLSHEVPLLWTMHHTHHSSPRMNLTTALRLNWIAKFVSPLFFAPLVMLGLSPVYVATSLAIGLLSQFLLHTQAIGRLGWFEGKLLNTPSAHRVHHGSNAQYIDKNYAGVFIVWDRLFGTFAEEREPVVYGITTPLNTVNPFVVFFHGFARLGRQMWTARGVGAKLGHLVRPPG